ncbi:hypothetical protein DSOL_4997 [Desulfosporosinus metallidurans]|uniref:Uncharacterized protein n=1 Tax=Desulfosporosinus metallidurans TaxID=1888891 RepID=A0A1Q8QGF8_9FIRM|nr:hypothetical protein DSOL_4997 [Desulfosporosinus metallidurans]
MKICSEHAVGKVPSGEKPQPIIPRLIQKGKPDGECSMSESA